MVSLVVYIYLIKPSYQGIDQKRGELAAKNNQLNDYKNTVDQIQKLLAAYDNLSQAQQSVSMMMPTEASIPQVVYQINGIAGISGLGLQSVSVKELAVTPSMSSLVKNMATLRFNTKLVGTYEALKAFINGLETNIRIFNISSINVEKLGTAANIFSFNINIDTYYQTK